MAVDAQPTDTHLDAGGDVIVTEGLTKVFDGRGGPRSGRRGPQPAGAPGRDLRAARPERRRQDDDRRHADDAGDPDSGTRAGSAASTSSRRPAAAKQVIGVVPQTNTLDRSLDVSENLFFHGRYFGMSAREAHDRRPASCSSSSGSPTGRRANVERAVGRHGAAADGRPGDHARPRRAVPRRADLRPRSAEPARALGRHRRAARAGPDDRAHDALHGRGRPALRAGRDHRPRPPARARHARAR